MTYLMMMKNEIRISKKHINNRFSLWSPSIPKMSQKMSQAKSAFNCVDDDL